MATQSTYYLNGASLSSATAVFTDAALTTCAPDGYYREGSIVRELFNCVLLPPQTCPLCADACGGPNIESSNAKSVSTISIDTGSNVGDVGAIIIRFNPLATPDGIQVEFNNIVYNSLSSPVYGYLSGVANMPTYIGASSGDCGLVFYSPHVLDVYNWYSGSFQTPTTTETVPVLASQLDLTVLNPDECVMVIPKVVAIPSVIDIKVISACDPGDFYINISCPSVLELLEVSEGFSSAEEACAASPNTIFYPVYVNGGSGTLGLYDWVFSDSYGQNVLPNNYYKSTACPLPNQWFRVENGVIVEFGAC